MIGGAEMNRHSVLNIGHGISLGVDQAGNWIVASKGNEFQFANDSDYYRAVTLLELSHEEASERFRTFMEREHVRSAFPFEKVVHIGLAGKSDQWARRALEWFSHLPMESRVELTSDLQLVTEARWASQKTRQVASRELKKLQTR